MENNGGVKCFEMLIRLCGLDEEVDGGCGGDVGNAAGWRVVDVATGSGTTCCGGEVVAVVARHHFVVCGCRHLLRRLHCNIICGRRGRLRRLHFIICRRLCRRRHHLRRLINININPLASSTQRCTFHLQYPQFTKCLLRTTRRSIIFKVNRISRIIIPRIFVLKCMTQTNRNTNLIRLRLR